MFKQWLIIFLISLSNYVYAEDYGVVFGQNTRIIMPSDKMAIGVNVSNYTSKHFLVHSKVVESDKQRGLSSNFMVTPELIELKPDSRQMLTVRRLSGEYPDDRESIVYLVGKFIPTEGGNRGAKIELAYSISLKLFLRPSKLLDGDCVEKSINEVEYKYSGGKLYIKNLSPYHLTYYKLKIDDKEIDVTTNVDMLLPFQESFIYYHKKPKSITWSFIGDSGFETAQVTRNFT